MNCERVSFEYLLLNGRLLVIFDGLDELLDTSYRREISGDIEMFCELYPSVPILVTSREVGYEQAPLDPDRFPIARIAPFDEDQIEEYVRKWFAQTTDGSEMRQQLDCDSFLVESEIVPDLRSNPLMLSLMCNLYRGENYIPRNRPDLYEKCSLLLFERWDKGRGIHVRLPFEAHIRPAMMYLAEWIYSSPELHGGVTEKRLVEKTKKYLCEKRFENPDEAEVAARQFIDFCRSRAWVFSDVGTTADGERIYQFTHRTFLEYFAASHLVRLYPTPSALGKVLSPRISQREWDVVAQLTFQIQNNNVDGAGDQLLETLLADAGDATLWEASAILSFAARSLEFMVPNPKTVRKIARACLGYCTNPVLRTRDGLELRGGPANLVKLGVPPAAILHSLTDATKENLPTVIDESAIFLEALMQSANDSDVALAFEIIWAALYLYHEGGSVRPQDNEFERKWEHVKQDIMIRNAQWLREASRTRWDLCTFALWTDLVSMTEALTWHGMTPLFVGSPFILVHGSYWSAYVESISEFRSHELTLKEKYKQHMSAIGVYALSQRPPCIRLPDTDVLDWIKGGWLFDRVCSNDASWSDSMKQHPEVTFGLLVLVLIVLELALWAQTGATSEIAWQLSQGESNDFKSLIGVIVKAFQKDGPSIAKMTDLLKRFSLSEAQQEFIHRWAQGANRLVDLKGAAE